MADEETVGNILIIKGDDRRTKQEIEEDARNERVDQAVNIIKQHKGKVRLDKPETDPGEAVMYRKMARSMRNIMLANQTPEPEE
jgi:hypothetical protein